MIGRTERIILNSLRWDYEKYPTFFQIVDIFRMQGIVFA